MDEKRGPAEAIVSVAEVGGSTASTPGAPPDIASALSELLKHPFWTITRLQAGAPLMSSMRLLAGGIACLAAYGAAAGFFQGGSQIGLAALKTPLIVLASLLLCAPSFFVFGSLARADLSVRHAAGLLSAFFGMLGLLLLGLLPIAWLFSFSSSSLVFATWLHVSTWAVALWFGWRFLRLAFPQAAAQRAALLWTILFAVVSFQMTTLLRPVLHRGEGRPIVEKGKLFFLEHLEKLKAPEAEKK